MPPLPRVQTDVIVDLLRQTAYASAEVRSRHTDRAERLALELDPQADVPEDFVIFRITGYRPEASSARLLKGVQVIADLAALVEILSDSLAAHGADSAGTAVRPLAELAREWGVSRKTIDRWRRIGLVARRTRGPSGKPTLVVREDVARAFAARHAAEIQRAASYSRIDEATARCMIRRAKRYKSRLGWTLARIARRLGERFGRSPNAVSGLLKRDAPVEFAPRGTIGADRGADAYERWRMGEDPAGIAADLRRSRPSVQRAIDLVRVSKLAALVAEGALSAPGVPHAGPRTSLDGLELPLLGAPGAPDLLSFIATARVEAGWPAELERDVMVAYHASRAQASNALDALNTLMPSPEALDRIETQLRLAARLKAEIARSMLGLVARTIDSQLPIALEEYRSAPVRMLLMGCVEAVARAIDPHDPLEMIGTGKRAMPSRLAASVGLTVSRVVATWSREHPPPSSDPRRAVSRIGAGAPLEDWSRRVAPWQEWLEPPESVRSATRRLPPAQAAWLGAKYGWDGGPPMMLTELSDRFGIARQRAPGFDRACLRLAITAQADAAS